MIFENGENPAVLAGLTIQNGVVRWGRYILQWIWTNIKDLIITSNEALEMVAAYTQKF